MVVPFRKFSTKKEAVLTSKIDQLIITIGIRSQKPNNFYQDAMTELDGDSI